MKLSIGIFSFLEEVSSLCHSIVSISLHCSLKKTFLSLLAILCNFAFKRVYLSFSLLHFTSLLFSTICKASADNHFALLHFFFLEMILVTVCCTVLQSSIHNSTGTLSDLIHWIYLSLPIYNHKWFHLGCMSLASDFPYTLQFKSEFCNKELMIWATVSSQSCFWWLYRASASVYGILQTRILEWFAISYSRDLPNPGIETASLISLALAGGLFITSAT